MCGGHRRWRGTSAHGQVGSARTRSGAHWSASACTAPARAGWPRKCVCACGRTVCVRHTLQCTPLSQILYMRRNKDEIVGVLARAVCNIAPYVIVNKREELLPILLLAIQSNKDAAARDRLTHMLFNLIKRPDEQQRCARRGGRGGGVVL